MARWALAKDLSASKPVEKKIATNSPVAKALKGSDDFSKHSKKMIEASEGLIKSGKCSLKEFEEMGGWMRSTNRGSGVYFAYCADTKVYLNVITGKVSN